MPTTIKELFEHYKKDLSSNSKIVSMTPVTRNSTHGRTTKRVRVYFTKDNGYYHTTLACKHSCFTDDDIFYKTVFYKKDYV